MRRGQVARKRFLPHIPLRMLRLLERERRAWRSFSRHPLAMGCACADGDWMLGLGTPGQTSGVRSSFKPEVQDNRSCPKAPTNVRHPGTGHLQQLEGRILMERMSVYTAWPNEGLIVQYEQPAAPPLTLTHSDYAPLPPRLGLPLFKDAGSGIGPEGSRRCLHDLRSTEEGKPAAIT